jgi:hypothetical protein
VIPPEYLGHRWYQNSLIKFVKEQIMKLSAPKNVTWWIAVVLGVLGILGTFISLPLVSANAFWFVAVGFVLLALATFLKDL